MSDRAAPFASLISIILPFLLPSQPNLFSSLVFCILKQAIVHEICLFIHGVISWLLPIENSFGDHFLVGGASNAINLGPKGDSGVEGI